jgi:hypothetical protein
MSDRGTKKGNDCVTKHLVNHTTKSRDVSGKPLKAAVYEAFDFFRIHGLRQSGEANNVSE